MAADSVPRKFRCIATEEAFSIPDQMDPMRKRALEAAHYDPDLFFWDRISSGSPLTRRLLDLDTERLQIMDAQGVDVHLLSLVSTGVQMFDADRAVELARQSNDVLAAAIARHPTRYAGLATVAPQDPARAVKEIERAMGPLHLNGLIINSHTNGEYLDERKYWPILEAAAAHHAPIYIHPRAPSPQMAGAYRAYTLEHAIWGFQAEAGLHGLRLIMSGVFDHFPDLKIVLGHMGEGLPYWLHRIDAMYQGFKVADRPQLKQLPGDYIRQNFLITTSGVNWSPALKFCIEVLSADNIMFAIDYPFVDTADSVRFLNEAPISDTDKAKIFHLNAERVFGIAPEG